MSTNLLRQRIYIAEEDILFCSINEIEAGRPTVYILFKGGQSVNLEGDTAKRFIARHTTEAMAEPPPAERRRADDYEQTLLALRDRYRTLADRLDQELAWARSERGQ